MLEVPDETADVIREFIQEAELSLRMVARKGKARVSLHSPKCQVENTPKAVSRILHRNVVTPMVSAASRI